MMLEVPRTTAGTAAGIGGLLPFIGETEEALACCCAGAAADPTATGFDPVAITVAGCWGFLEEPAAEAYDPVAVAVVVFGAGIFCWFAGDVISEVISDEQSIFGALNYAMAKESVGLNDVFSL